jgi:hypothetical protein
MSTYRPCAGVASRSRTRPPALAALATVIFGAGVVSGASVPWLAWW